MALYNNHTNSAMSDGEDGAFVDEEEEEMDELNDNGDVGDIDVDPEEEAEENKSIDAQLAHEDDVDEEQEEIDEEIKHLEEKQKKQSVISKRTELYNTDTIIIIKPANRITRNIISIAEWSALIAQRVATLQNGEQHFLLPGTTVPSSPIDIARIELEQRRSPFLIIRHISPKYIEMWNPNNMSHPKSESWEVNNNKS
jgi:hypothetical protein